MHDPGWVEGRWVEHQDRPAAGDAVEERGVADDVLASFRRCFDLDAVGPPHGSQFAEGSRSGTPCDRSSLVGGEERLDRGRRVALRVHLLKLDAAASKLQIIAVSECRRARAARRTGNRADRQLLQPGAVRRPHDAAVGPRDRARAPARWLRAVRHLPPDVPLRADLEPAARRCARVARPAWPGPRAGAVRALRRRVLPRPDRRGAPARGPGSAHLRAAAELLRREHPLRRRHRMVRAHPTRARAPEDGPPWRGAAGRGRTARADGLRPGSPHEGCPFAQPSATASVAAPR